MGKFSTIIVLLLTLIWGYTSWYWYTCNIKGHCDATNEQQDIKDTNMISVDDVIIESDEDDTEIGDIQDISTSPKLSANDVLSETIIQKKEEKTSEEIIINEEVTGTGELLEEKPEKIPGRFAMCDTPLVGPIGIGADNNKKEVEILEEFLIAQAEITISDGIYGQDDLEAVKRFQLKYKKDILDPWGITQPTGYVFKTTLKKINEIACQ